MKSKLIGYIPILPEILTSLREDFLTGLSQKKKKRWITHLLFIKTNENKISSLTATEDQ